MNLANIANRTTKTEASSSSKWLCILRQAASGRAKRYYGGMWRWWSIWMTWLILSIDWGALTSSLNKAGRISSWGFRKLSGDWQCVEHTWTDREKWAIIAELRPLKVFSKYEKPDKTWECWMCLGWWQTWANLWLDQRPSPLPSKDSKFNSANVTRVYKPPSQSPLID